MARLISLLSILICFASCDPGFSVVLSNNSQADKNITVLVNDKYPFRLRDSVLITDTLVSFFEPYKSHVTNIVTHPSQAGNAYSFQLEKGKKVLLQNGIGGPDLSQRIVVNNTDSISLSKKEKRVLIKRKFMYTTVNIKVE